METSTKFLLGGLAAFGLLFLLQPKAVATPPASGTPSPNPTPPAGNRVQVGDVVTVKLSDSEPTDLETSLASAPSPRPPTLTMADVAVMSKLDALSKSGGTAKFKVTATGLASLSTSNKGQDVTIGVLVDPALSFRLPVGFLTASVLSVERNGQVVS